MAACDPFILANDKQASFIFIKRTAAFAYAWTTLVPIADGKFGAFGNNHSGKCSINPFSQAGE